MPVILQDTSFNVWVNLYETEGNFKCFALPIIWGVQEQDVYANNYELPITITWDHSLFEADIILDMHGYQTFGLMDNSYLFNYDFSGAFFMFMHNGELILPYYEIQGQEVSHFPFFINLSPDWGNVTVRDFDAFVVSHHPNPAKNTFHISTPENITSIEIRDLNGKQEMALQQGGGGV